MQSDTLINHQSTHNSIFFVNGIIKKYIRELLEYTMFKGKDMSDNISVYFDSTNGHLYVEYIGYKDTDFHNGQYFILFSLPHNYPQSPPDISILTESGRFYVNQSLSLSITRYHEERWIPISFITLIVSMISVFPEYDMIGIGHIRRYEDNPGLVIRQIATNTRDYNERHNQEMYEIFNKINKLKMTGTVSEINSYIDTVCANF
jgi:ubiquitin-protein ligase